MAVDRKYEIGMTRNRHQSETITLSLRNINHCESGVWAARIASQSIDES
jgi:hypothetical protein